MLLVALEQLDAAETARKQIARDGLTVATAKGDAPHPSIKTRQEALKMFLDVWRRLELVGDPIEYAGPPPSPFDHDGLFASINEQSAPSGEP